MKSCQSANNVSAFSFLELSEMRLTKNTTATFRRNATQAFANRVKRPRSRMFCMDNFCSSRKRKMTKFMIAQAGAK